MTELLSRNYVTCKLLVCDHKMRYGDIIKGTMADGKKIDGEASGVKGR